MNAVLRHKPPIASLVVSETPMQTLYREWQQTSARRDAIAREFANPDWDAACLAATKARMKIAVCEARTAEDVWLKAHVAFQVAGGDEGLSADIDADLEDGKAYDRTLAASLLIDLMRLRPAI